MNCDFIHFNIYERLRGHLAITDKVVGSQSTSFAFLSWIVVTTSHEKGKHNLNRENIQSDLSSRCPDTQEDPTAILSLKNGN